MSELINTNDNRATIRWKLLTGVSALALMAYVSSASVAKAEDADRPALWIELGGQMEMMQGLNAPVIAPFMTITPTPGPYADDIFVKGQKPPRFSFGEEGKISFQPNDSDWILSASIRYGRSGNNKHIHHQSPNATYISRSGQTVSRHAAAFADIKSRESENHAILDFSAGKDVGLGVFGHDGTSNISAGVRFAQLSGKSNVSATGRPVINFPLAPHFSRHEATFYNYTMHANAKREFHGVGPSLSWTASAALAGNKQDGELTLDWSLDGAILFGRQKAKINHTTQAYKLPFTSAYNGYYHYYKYAKTYEHPHPNVRSRRVVVPNLSGVVGVSMKYPNVKFSIGYRYDTFLNAMDTGIDTARKSNVTFNGPYASISVGIGD